MSILTPCEIYFENLAGTMNPRSLQYMSKELAYERLKKMIGQDFGFDVDRWKDWLVREGMIRLSPYSNPTQSRTGPGLD
jgi:hypothetical protein